MNIQGFKFKQQTYDNTWELLRRKKLADEKGRKFYISREMRSIGMPNMFVKSILPNLAKCELTSDIVNDILVRNRQRVNLLDTKRKTNSQSQTTAAASLPTTSTATKQLQFDLYDNEVKLTQLQKQRLHLSAMLFAARAARCEIQDIDATVNSVLAIADKLIKANIAYNSEHAVDGS